MLHRFRRDRRGVAAVEFALVAMPFFMFLLGIFQISLLHFAQESLDEATRSATRIVMTGKVPSNAQSASGFRTGLICSKLFLNLECDNISVTASKLTLTSDMKSGTGIYQFLDSNNKSLKIPGTGFCIGGANDYIFLTVTYTFSSNFAKAVNFFANGGSTTLRSTSLIRNEPFSSGGASC